MVYRLSHPGSVKIYLTQKFNLHGPQVKMQR